MMGNNLMKTIKRIPEYLLRAVLALFAALPLRVHYFNARLIAFLVHRVFRYRVDVVEDNLLHAFPQMTDAQRQKVQKEFYLHFASIIVEAIWFGGCRNGGKLHKAGIVRIKNPETIEDSCRKNKGVAVLYSHAGNWELLGGIPNYDYTGRLESITECNSCFVYRKQSSEMWDRILRDNRIAPLHDKDGYEGYLESRNFVRYVFANRGKQKIYYVNTDQRPYFSAPDFIRVNFLNRECNTMSAIAAVAVKFGMSVLFQRMTVNEDGRGYTIEYVPVCDNAGESSPEEIMKTYYRLLEDDIRCQPFNYLWTHRRWA